MTVFAWSSFFPQSPFPSGSVQHALFVDASRKAAEEDAALIARVPADPRMADAVNLAVGRYDVWAKWLMLAFVVNFKTAEAFQTQLTAWRDYLEELVEPKLEPSLRTTLRIRLHQRSMHWMSQASQLARTAEQPLAPSSEGIAVSWSDIKIVFISDERVQVYVLGRTHHTANYAEMGFEDARSGIPNKAWAALKALAYEGELKWRPKNPASPAGRKFLERRVQEIRKTLRQHLAEQHITLPDDDPLPLKKTENAYLPTFKVTAAPSAET